MLPRQGMRRSYCWTTAIPALVTVTGFVGPSVAGVQPAARRDLELLHDRMRLDELSRAGLLDDVAEPCDVFAVPPMALT